MKYYVAFDCGATSCRACLAGFEGDAMIVFKEIGRFPNGMQEENGKFYWDAESIASKLLDCLRGLDVKPESIGIDTWGVDFGFLADNRLLERPRAYRDPYTRGVPSEVFRIIPEDQMYALNGLQTMEFNSVFQLFGHKKEGSAEYLKADTMLFMPDLLAWIMTGEKVMEWTEASTSGLLNPVTHVPDGALMRRLGLREGLLGRAVKTGEVIGTLKPEWGLGPIPVVAVAGHDTASAISAIPSPDGNFAFLSSGTWSLMGIVSDRPVLGKEAFEGGFSNEGCIHGKTGLLKNITGMWLLEQCRTRWKEEGFDVSYQNLISLGKEEASFPGRIFPDDPRFANPSNMEAEISAASGAVTKGQIVSVIFHSLAQRYADVLTTLRKLSPHPIDRLHVVGGGAANAWLNQLTADAAGIPVVAGPIEATALGNVMIQAGVNLVNSPVTYYYPSI